MSEPEAPGQEAAAVPQEPGQEPGPQESAPQESAPQESAPQESAPQAPAPVQVRVRRAPRYRVFVATGALLGALLGIVAALLLGDPASLFAPSTVTGYLAAIGLLLGGLAGGAVAVLVDRPGR